MRGFFVFMVLLLLCLRENDPLFLSLGLDILLEDLLVANNELVDQLHEAGSRRSLVVIDGKAILEYLLYNEMPIITLVIFARILRISIDL